jgi:hypothetical protein
MSDLATFLELLHTAGSLWRTLHAKANLTMNPGAAMASAAEMFRSMGVSMPPMPPGLNALPSGPQQREFRIAAAGREAVRIEQTGEERTIAISRRDGTATFDALGEWQFEPIADKTLGFGGRMPIRSSGPLGGAHSFGLIAMLDSSALLGSCRFESAEALVLQGRPALRCSGRPQAITFPIGLVSNGLHPGTSRIELTVDVATGIIVRFEELSDAGLVSSRLLQIESVDEPIDETLFELPVDVESTKASRGLDRFDDPLELASSVDFAVYLLNPAPLGARLLCMRESANQTRITYLPAMTGPSSGRLFRPVSVTSSRSKEADRDFQGEGWQRVEVHGHSAWVWTGSKDDHIRSHVRILFDGVAVELAGEFLLPEALQLAGTLRKVRD